MPLVPPTRVSELDSLDLIESLEAAYLEKNECRVINVSHWDSSAQIKASLRNYLDIPLAWPAEDYLFSYSDEAFGANATDLRSAFGFEDASGYLITPSGSTSIVCVVNWLAAMGATQLTVCSPAYFSLFHICKRCRIEIVEKFMTRTSLGYQLPDLTTLNQGKPGVLWLTNPVYSTGVSISAECVKKIESLLQCGWYVIADECLAIQELELGHILGRYSRFVGIYAPHKGICINAVKFSAILFDRENQRFFDHWADILYGCLSISTRAAVIHFLSPNFSIYRDKFLTEIALARDFVGSAAANTLGAITDRNATGCFTTCYFPGLEGEKGNDPRFLEKVIAATGGSFIPGCRNHFDAALGFNFRVNLSRDSTMFRGALMRLLGYLDKICQH